MRDSGYGCSTGETRSVTHTLVKAWRSCVSCGMRSRLRSARMSSISIFFKCVVGVGICCPKDRVLEIKCTSDFMKDFAFRVEYNGLGCVNNFKGRPQLRRKLVTGWFCIYFQFSALLPPVLSSIGSKSCTSTCRLYKRRCYEYRHAMQLPTNAQMRRDASPRCMTTIIQKG